ETIATPFRSAMPGITIRSEVVKGAREHRSVTAYESVSTWKQPPAPPPSPVRAQVIAELADRICARSPRRSRVAVDGRTGAGKSTFADELAAAVRERGRPTLRGSLADLHKPGRDA